MDITAQYVIFGFFLVLTALISYWLASKSASQTQVNLEVAKSELQRFIKLEASQSQELQQLTQYKADVKVKIGKLESVQQSLETNSQRLQQEVTKTLEELYSIREMAQKSKENEAKLGTELISTTAAKDELKQLNREIQSQLTNSKTEVNTFTAQNSELKANVKSTTDSLRALKGQNETLQAELTNTKTQNSTTQSDLSESRANLESVSNECNIKKNELAELKLEHKSLQIEHYKIKQENAEITIEMQTKQTHFDEQFKLLQENKKELKKEFENLANEILERKGKAFKELNSESMTAILNPIHEELKGFKNKVEDIHGKESEQRVQLRTELENLQKLNREITDQADKLTTALKGEKKVQGNWGELMLENVLDNAGLRLGKDYKREVSFNTEEGKLRPDAVVYLPQNKHLVIDAKTSLNAYTRYVNSQDDTQRSTALKEHSQAVRDRLNELSSKDYCKLPGINSPEVVVMFIPIESAYVAALKADEQLFQLALDNNILIATPTTLLTSLNIVRQLWRFEEQNKHTAELASRAERFYNKLSTFLTSMQGVGKQLDKAKETYEKAFGQLYTGRGNLIKQAAEFKELGVSVQNELPKDLIDKANLELGKSYIDDAALIELKSTEEGHVNP